MPDKTHDDITNTALVNEEPTAAAGEAPTPPGPKASTKKQPRKYTHLTCGTEMEMSDSVAADFYANPDRYSSLYCSGCGVGVRIGEDGEVVWTGGKEKVTV
jgi:hypothetical protein